MPAAAKRKKTSDMPDSPPKRVTRSRAKTKDEMEEKAAMTKASPALKVNTRVKKPTVEPIKSTKRKTRSHDTAEQAEQEVESMEVESLEAPKLRGQARKSNKVTEKTDDASGDVKPKPRTRKVPTAKAAENSEEPLKSRRGRPRRDEEGAAPMKAKDDMILEGPIVDKKVSRVRAAAKPTHAVDSQPVFKAATMKKRVKFEDELQTEKENIPLPTKKEKKPAVKSTGLRAKPVRKAAATRSAATESTATTRKMTQTKSNVDQATEGPRSMPLSPKKITQVAKSGSVGSEDELNGDKAPVRALSRSPVKIAQSSPRNIDDSPLKVNLALSGLSSPSKTFSASVLTSPARRPPASPFKNSMKESPKRGDISLQQQHNVSRALATSPLKSSLQMSPKRGLLFSANKPNFAQPSTAQSSLLQSPARRPLGSPTKSIFALSPVKSVRKPESSPRNSNKEFIMHNAPSEEVVSSPLRAERSNRSILKPYVLTLDGQEAKETKKSKDSEITRNLLEEADAAGESVTPSKILTNGDIFSADFETLAKSSPLLDNTATDIVDTNSQDVEPVKAEAGSTTPTSEPRFSLTRDVDIAPISFREAAMDADSEDELSPTKVGSGAGLSTFGISSRDFANPFTKRVSISPVKASPGTMTPLAERLSSWAASSPQEIVACDDKAQGISLTAGVNSEGSIPDDVQTIIMERSPTKPSQFDEQMDIPDGIEGDTSIISTPNTKDDLNILTASMESSSSTEYGDENEIPLDPELLVEGSTVPRELTCTPARVFETREIHTVSKVPLRPADDEMSPLKITKKRSKSISGHISSSRIPQSSNLKRNSFTVFPDQAISLPKLASAALEQEQSISAPAKQHSETEEYDLLAHVASPIGTSRKPESNVLKGVTAFVDVHTSEGADASGIFHDLLNQMGAKCVKQWNWNPRASVAQGWESVDENVAANKPGITHVIYKDGGKRTLEKVRAAAGVVDCVGVGWVLE